MKNIYYVQLFNNVTRCFDDSFIVEAKDKEEVRNNINKLISNDSSLEIFDVIKLVRDEHGILYQISRE